MQAPATDAIALLEAIAQAHPDASDLTFECWELGFSEARMDQAVEALLATGWIELEAAAASTRARHARLTAKGLELARSRGLGGLPSVGERRRLNDRRTTQAEGPPPGLGERRHSRGDRRHLHGR